MLLASFAGLQGPRFLEAHPQNRLSILAACEDPYTVAQFDYAGKVWPLPQTGQMWLEYELLKNPKAKGYFCLSTSYRQEQTPIEGRHDLIFPLLSSRCTAALTRSLRWKRTFCGSSAMTRRSLWRARITMLPRSMVWTSWRASTRNVSPRKSRPPSS